MKPSTKEPNLYLVGFMGTGKTAVGKRLADQMGFTFIDSDYAIERQEGVSISQIFERQGEAAFRKLELAFIESGHPTHGCVVSCGGGLITQSGMIDLLKAKGVLVCLFASPETIIQRTSGNSKRPLLQGGSAEEKVRHLLSVREPLYKQAGTLITTDHRPLQEIIGHIRRVYQEERGAFEVSA